ncbi:MAG: YlxR family protein [Clostridia bacterium]|nr:YlxR family protein [Clostridia bacterium]
MKTKKTPLRMCLGCREMIPKKEMIRVVRAPEDMGGEISLDPSLRKPGRGAYLCGKPECFEKAKKINAFAKAFSCQVAPAVYDELAAALGKTKTAE